MNNEKRFILRDTEKESIVSAGTRTFDPWIMGQTLYRHAIWLADEIMDIKVAYTMYIKYQMLCLKINQVYAIVI